MTRIAWSSLILACQLILYIPLSDSCVRTSSGNSPTTSVSCPPSTTQALLYIDNSAMIDQDFYGMVPPTSTCETCSTGKSEYFPDSGDPVIQSSNEKAIGGMICENFCICEADGTCYKRNSPTTSIVLYPYCAAGTCSVYALVLGEQNTDGIVSVDGSSTITASSQVNPATTDNFPVTQNNLFPKITAVSCNGCDFMKSCS